MAEAEHDLQRTAISWPDGVCKKKGFVTTEASDAAAF